MKWSLCISAMLFGVLGSLWILTLAWGKIRGVFKESIGEFIKTFSQRKRLEAQWPDLMFFLAGLLKSGLSLEQAFHVVIEDFPDPMKTFLRKRCERRQGTVQDRIEQIFSGADLKFARAVLLLSGRTGSSAGLLLDKSAKAMRRKQELTEKMKVLSAQGKVSAWVVAHASFLLLLTFYFFMPEFISPLFETREGWFILVSILVLNLLGLFVAHRMIRLD